jgi:two-component system OmpR family sensor kinase
VAEEGFTARVRGADARLAERARHLSLRTRLLAVTLALVTVGLAIAGVVTYTSLRSFLLDRVDDQLRSAVIPSEQLVDDGDFSGFGPPRRGGFGPDLPQGSVVGLYTSDGTNLIRQLPTDVVLPTEVGTGFFNGDIPGKGAYRFVAGNGIDTNGDGRARVFSGRLLVGVPLSDVNDTLGRLLLIELLVGVVVLGAVGGAGFWLVRVGMRPLEDIEHTAGAIAAGDLSRRIDDEDPNTEVGRLGGALNTMLGTIEAAFAERKESERRLRQFVADASHELQTPLTSVRGYAELFRRGAADRPDDLSTAMRRIEAESERMGVLVDDLLLLAHLDQNRPMARGRVDLRAITHDLVGDTRVVDPGRPLTFVAPEPVVIDGDEQRLKQVVANLLSNARTHTPPGTPVTVRVRREADEAIIEVEDRGPGMTPEHAARVFERFFRADPSRARASGGSGLGLSIVSAIAEAHGGRVEVATNPGDGATFRVRLPMSGGGQLAAGGPSDV